jgi:hypothetical protein
MSEIPQIDPSCRWCGCELCQDRDICQKCDRDQNRFFEKSKQLVTLAAAVGVLASAIAYVWPSVQKTAVSFSDPVLKVKGSVALI